MPRLLEVGRVEVKLSKDGGTHVFTLASISSLMDHLTEAAKLLGHDCQAAAEQRGIVKGMRAAAEIASTAMNGIVTYDGKAMAVRNAILAAAEKEGAEWEVCEWARPKGWSGMHDTGCGHLLDYEDGFKGCPYCLKPIKLNG